MIRTDAANAVRRSCSRKRRNAVYSAVSHAVRNGGRNTLTGSTARQSTNSPAQDVDGRSRLMGTASVSTVLTGVIFPTDLEEVLQMSEKQFQAEKLYYISISIAKSMLEKGVIDREVFAVIDTKLLEKYRPISATLLSGNPLT